MKMSLENALVRRWPAVFRGRIAPVAGNSLSHDFNCDDGWYPIVDALAETLTDHARGLGREPPEMFEVKQKSGGLRLNLQPADGFDRGVLATAQSLSYRICEMSGAPGRPSVRGGLYKSLAPEVAQREGFRVLGSDSDPTRRMSPVPSQEAAELLEWEHLGIVIGDVCIPPGWYDLARVLLSYFAYPFGRPETEHARIFDLRSRSGRLVVEYEGGRESDRGAAAFVATMSTRIDPITGVAHVPGLD